MDKVYGFSNENVAAYLDLYNMDEANVLSVIGSGDQYFTALLGGAKEITLYDININAWYYFVLKYMAIKYLSFEEFITFFVDNNLNNIALYLKIRDYLPYEARMFWDRFRIIGLNFSSAKLNNTIFSSFKVKDYEKYIPYFKIDEFYRLKEILNHVSLPNVMINDFVNIAESQSRGSYDLVFLSNIYHWIDKNPEEFKRLLDKYDSGVIQAMYAWSYTNEVENFWALGFDVDLVDAVNKATDFNKNYVLTYKK